MKFKKKLSTISNKINMKQKTCAEIIGEAEEKIKNSQVTNAAYEYSDSLKKTVIIHGFGIRGVISKLKARNQTPIF